jgi:diguanylate cyclase (GGDEF)-like protein
VLGLLLLVAVALLDHVAGPHYSFSIFYLLVVILVSASNGTAYALPLSLIAAGIWAGVESANLDLSDPWLPLLWNTAARFAVLLVTASLVAAVVSMAREESERSRADALTGLLNRRGLCDVAALEVARAGRSGEPFTLLYLDIDGFKAVNDSDGHLAGDRLLSEVGRAIEAHVRRSDTAARIGGDEFVVLLPDTPSEPGVVAAQRLSAGLDALCRTGSWPVRFSIGAATFVEAPASVDQLLSEADRLMYAAKRTGKRTGRSPWRPRSCRRRRRRRRSPPEGVSPPGWSWNGEPLERAAGAVDRTRPGRSVSGGAV